MKIMLNIYRYTKQTMISNSSDNIEVNENKWDVMSTACTVKMPLPVVSWRWESLNKESIIVIIGLFL